jgi:thiosulfate/3-mercaptopyruvate sulfurtransferase
MEKSKFHYIRKTISVILFMPILLLMSSLAHTAECANPHLLVTPADIEKNAGNWVVLDCRDGKAYAAGHLPGAITLGDACGKILRDATIRVKSVEALEKMLGNSGVSMDKPVVVYADAQLITGTTVAFWVLEYLGHDKVYFLNGGIEEWKKAGRQITTSETKLPPAPFKAKVMKNRIATSDEMARIARGEVKGANVIDSRSEKEHQGDDIRALRGGFIPNTTVNISHVKTYDVQAGRIHSMDDLEKIFGRLDKTKRTIPYCQTGTRSTLTYLQLRLMGFKEPANYDDSWTIYGSRMDYPVGNENWYDFVKVNNMIKQIDELKKEVEELKKR